MCTFTFYSCFTTAYFILTLCLQDNVVEDTMSVDPKHHRYFVARRGQVLRDLADEYGGVMVSFPRTGTQSDKVTLKGAKECVEAAKKRMLEIVEDLVSRYSYVSLRWSRWCVCVFFLLSTSNFYSFELSLFQDAQVTMECVIPQKFHRSIMGPKGSRIQQITRDHNVQIKFPEREDPQGKHMSGVNTCAQRLCLVGYGEMLQHLI